MEILVVIPKDINNIIPLIFEYKKQIKSIHLVYDTSLCEFEKALDLKNGLIKLNNKYSLKWNIKLYPIDEDKKEHIEKLYEIDFKYLFISENTDVTLSVLLSAMVLKKNGIIYSYDKGENTYNVISRDIFENKKIKHNLKLEDYLTMLNYEIEEKTTLNDIKSRRKLILKVFESNIDNSVKKALESLGALKNGVVNKSYLGNLFEEYMFWHVIKFDFDEVWLNVKIISEKLEKEEIKNEIDILAIKNNTIFVFEVKKGTLAPFRIGEKRIVPSRLGVNIIYKLDSIMSIFGRYSRGIIINQNLNPKTASFSKNLIKRAEENNILIYEFKKFNFSKLKKLFLNFNLFERVFLLGGRDLEMQTIKEILKKFDLKFYDKNLSWGNAKLSAYKDCFNEIDHFYGIELIEDITPPQYYTSIDHHNYKRFKLSSLEQIAKLLNYKLSRREKLVAINDREHILGMKKFGASDKEIENIRKKERRLQGIGEKEEAQAMKDIENGEVVDGVLVIYTKNNNFSPIADRVFDKEVIIYNDKELNYYGKRVHLLIKHFKDLIDKKLAYFGRGFFGILKEPLYYKAKILEILRKN